MREVAYLGAAAFVLTAIVAVTAFAWDRPLQLVGSAVDAAGSRLGLRERLVGLPERLLARRNEIRRAFRDRPVTAFLGATGKSAFDFGALLCILSAFGARPRPSLVLLPDGAAQLLTMIPATPGVSGSSRRA